MTEKGMFKKRLFGFKKKQVLEYIYELTAEHKRETDELSEQLRAAEEKAEELSLKIEELSAEYEESRSEHEKTLEILKGVTDECAEYKELCESLRSKVFYFTSRKESVEKEIAAARQYAEKITSEAREKADAIIKESREYTKTVEANVELIKKDAEEIRADIRESLTKLEDNLIKLGALGEERKHEIPVRKPVEKKSSNSLLREIKNIFRGVGY